MRKNESRIKLLISGLLLLTALLIIILTYFSPASLQNNQFQKEDSQNVYNDSSDKKNDPGISKKRDPNILSKKNTNIDNSTENRTENYTENNIENKNLFSEKSSKSARAAARANSSVSGKNKVLYFIIDDAGYNLEKLKPFLDFPGDLTIAVLPGLTYSKQSAALAIKKGKKVILHQPMESVNGNDTGPHAIKMGMQENEIIEILEHNISSISGIIGMNNHMGSAVTTDERIMKIILKYLYNKNLFFIDSMTTHDSICKKAAADSGFAIMHRDVFLDNINDRKAILESINTGKTIALNKGYAVMIGHVWSSELADTLMYIYPQLIEEGFTIEGADSLPKREDHFASIGN